MKKARLDVLDITDAVEAVSEPLQIDEPHIDLQEESSLGKEEAKPSRWRVFLSWKMLLLFGISIVIMVVIGAFLITYMTPSYKDAVSSPAKKPAKGIPPVAKSVSVYFENMAVVANDLAGNKRVILFSIAVTPGKKAAANLDGDREIRLIAARAVSGMLFPELMSPKGREIVKKKIKSDIEISKGSGVAEDVWITSWTIL